MTYRAAGSLAGNTWREWANYWVKSGHQIPPIHRLRAGAGRDEFFVVALSPSELAVAVAGLAKESTLRFTVQGSWALPPLDWFGDWSVFSSTPR